MRTIRNIIIAVFVFSILTSLNGGETEISGKVIISKPEIAKCILLIKVVAMRGNRVLATGHELLDETGAYKLHIPGSVVPSKEKPVDVFVAGLGIDTMYVKSFYSFESNNISLDITMPNDYAKDASGNVMCPKCGGIDDILPIKYGAHHRIQRKIHNGDTTYVPLDHNIPSPLYSDLHPYWYCNKCKIQF